MRYLDMNGAKLLVRKMSELINQRIYDAQLKGLSNCSTCGAPFTGKPNCEYCGRGFFIDYNMYRWDELWTNN